MFYMLYRNFMCINVVFSIRKHAVMKLHAPNKKHCTPKILVTPLFIYFILIVY